MELTTEQARQITKEVIENRPLTLSGPEVDEYVRSLKETLAMCEEKGWVLAVPGEWEV